MDNIILYDFIFSDEELKPYREMYNDWKGKSPIDPKQGEREILSLEDNYPSPNKIVESYSNAIPEKIAKGFNGCLSVGGYSVDAKLSLYNETQSYGWHCDQDGIVFHEKNPRWTRIISSITYLNDDFEGGETEFADRVIKPESGKTLVFPSSFLYPHRGCPVRSGIKKILVMHFWY